MSKNGLNISRAGSMEVKAPKGADSGKMLESVISLLSHRRQVKRRTTGYGRF